MREHSSDDVVRWIEQMIPSLGNNSKFRALNSVRFAKWADDLKQSAPPLASFCAMHAVEEAVAAFICAAKTCGHAERAKQVNIRDHASKALASIFGRRASMAANIGKLAVAVHPDSTSLVYRVPTDEAYSFGRLHLNAFYIDFDGNPDVGGRVFLGEVPLLEDIEAEIARTTDARNAVLYASEGGYPTGFLDVEREVKQHTALSLGLIWACIDLHLDPERGGAFVEALLDKMIEFNAARKTRKRGLSAAV